MAFDRRLLALKLIVAFGTAVSVGTVDARNAAEAGWSQLAPWCAYLGGFGGNFDCSYHTLEQCLATARGLGGFCSPNPRVSHDPYWKPRRSRGYR
jgi:Protein of unknown function (DUF3551)